MDDLLALVNAIRQKETCKVDPPCGLPALPKSMSLPADLKAFYEAAGGARLYSEHQCAGNIRILSPKEFQRIDLVITGDCFATGPFKWWYAIADVRDGNYIAIDLNPEYRGLCYDAFHETFAMPGYVSVIASSFSDLLRRLLHHEEDSTYWLQDDFKRLGEAFTNYGYEPLE